MHLENVFNLTGLCAVLGVVGHHQVLPHILEDRLYIAVGHAEMFMCAVQLFKMSQPPALGSQGAIAPLSAADVRLPSYGRGCPPRLVGPNGPPSLERCTSGEGLASKGNPSSG